MNNLYYVIQIMHISHFIRQLQGKQIIQCRNNNDVINNIIKYHNVQLYFNVLLFQELL